MALVRAARELEGRSCPELATADDLRLGLGLWERRGERERLTRTVWGGASLVIVEIGKPGVDTAYIVGPVDTYNVATSSEQ